MKSFLTLISLLLTSSIALAKTTPQTAYEAVKRGKAVLIDVREKHEVELGMIRQAQWFALSSMTPSNDWLNDFKAMTRDKSVFLYCRSGKRAEKAKKILADKGIEAQNLGGYMTLKKVLPTNGGLKPSSESKTAEGRNP